MQRFIQTTFAALALCLLAAGASAAEVETERAADLISHGALVIDVRTPEEVEQGTIPGALTIPHDELARLQAVVGEGRSQPVVLYCGSGRRAGIAIEALREGGYGGEGLVNGGGFDALNQAVEQAEAEIKE